MTSPEEADRWSKVEALFDAVIELPARDRVAHLDTHCGDDPGLRGEVESLIEAAEQEGDLFDQPAAAVVRVRGVAVQAAGRRIGAWAILDFVGRGGMGEVYRAERADGQFQQQVAIKLLRPEAVDHLQRFHEERRLLARLEHPGIARLLDGGVTDDGRPYMVMEWVEGNTITRWCSDHDADLRRRLDVFDQVCEAVGYAHRNLLVHRDLKPANVLVTSHGRAKLLDFGIAKFLGSDADETRTVAPMTPAYAAPEQLAQGPITTATDVYSLGLILFELLTGERPLHQGQMTLARIVERVLREDAPAASLVAARNIGSPVSPALLRGDLDHIIAKALRKTPEHRYETVAAFQADVQRHLRGEPIAARRGARGYVLGRYLARYRWGVAGVMAIVVSLAAGLAGTAWQARKAQVNEARAETARASAEREAARANSTKDFLVRIFEASDPRIAQDKPRGQITAKDLLDLNAPRIGDQFRDDPDTQIELLGIVSSIYLELDEEEKARALRAQQVDLARRTHGELHPAITGALLEEAERAASRQESGKVIAALDQADPLIHRAGRDHSAERAHWWFLRAEALAADDRAAVERHAALETAVKLFAEVAPDDPWHARAFIELGQDELARDPARAEPDYRRAIAVAEAIGDRGVVELQLAANALAVALESMGDYDGAAAAYEKAVSAARRSYGEQSAGYWIPAVLHARLIHRQGRRIEAHALFDHLLQVLPRDWADNTFATTTREFLAACLSAEGAPEQAIPVLETALQRYLDHPGRSYDVRRARRILGDAYDQAGRSGEARSTLKAAYDENVAKESPDDAVLLLVRERWGRFLLDQHDVDGGDAQFREVVARAGSRRIEPIALAQGGLARTALARQAVPDALEQSAAAIDTFEHVTGSRDVRTGPYLWLIRSAALRASGDAKGARDWAGRALQASESYDDPDSPAIALAKVSLARADLALGQADEARELALGARSILSAHAGVGSQYREPLQDLARHLPAAVARHRPTDSGGSRAAPAPLR